METEIIQKITVSVIRKLRYNKIVRKKDKQKLHVISEIRWGNWLTFFIRLRNKISTASSFFMPTLHSVPAFVE